MLALSSAVPSSPSTDLSAASTGSVVASDAATNEAGNAPAGNEAFADLLAQADQPAGANVPGLTPAQVAPGVTVSGPLLNGQATPTLPEFTTLSPLALANAVATATPSEGEVLDDLGAETTEPTVPADDEAEATALNPEAAQTWMAMLAYAPPPPPPSPSSPNLSLPVKTPSDPSDAATALDVSGQGQRATASELPAASMPEGPALLSAPAAGPAFDLRSSAGAVAAKPGIPGTESESAPTTTTTSAKQALAVAAASSTATAAASANATPAQPSAQIAGPVAASSAASRDALVEKNKNIAQTYDKKEYNTSKKTDGTGKAYDSGVMSPSYTPTASPVVSVKPAELPAPVAPAAATRLVEQVAEAAERLSASSIEKLDLRIELEGNQHVDVHVSMRGGRVHADFRSDSPEVRAALSSAWEGFVQSREGAAQRWAEPVFSAPATNNFVAPVASASGAADSGLASSGQNQERRESQGREPESAPGWSGPASRSGARFNGASAATPATDANRRPDTSRHLSVIA